MQGPLVLSVAGARSTLKAIVRKLIDLSAPHCKVGLERYSQRVTSYGSLQYFTNEKLFQRHLVCHGFLLITFAFRGCSRSVEPLRRQTGNKF